MGLMMKNFWPFTEKSEKSEIRKTMTFDKGGNN